MLNKRFSDLNYHVFKNYLLTGDNISLKMINLNGKLFFLIKKFSKL